ncbi:MAG: type II secretion system protein [Polaromonas sp.]|nr:type II secretion system protein [Polaromonas sp.]
MFMNRRRARGFTLIEAIVFIVVVSTGLAGIMLVVDTVVKASADPLVRKQSMSIAESLLEEILLRDYARSGEGQVAPTARAGFDTVGDYAGYSTRAGIEDRAGAPVTGLDRYNISPPVSVVPTGELTGVAALKVTVHVTGPVGTVSLSGYRGSY